MKFYDIALFIFIVNLTIGMVNQINLLQPFASQIEGMGQAEIEAGEEKISETIGENQNVVLSTLNWLVENVRLTIQALSSFLKIFLDATVFCRGMYIQFLCQGGVDCSFSSPMGSFINILWLLTYFVYTMGIVQFGMGRSIKEVE